MAGLMSWIWDKVGLGDPVDDDYPEDVYAEEETDYEEEEEMPISAQVGGPNNNVVPLNPRGGASAPSAGQTGGAMSNYAANGSSSLVIYTPSKYDDLPELVTYLRQGRPIVVSFEGKAEEDMRRMLDFIFGAACALEGSAQKVSHNIFVVTPASVDVTSNRKETLLARDSLLRGSANRISVQDDD